MKLLIIEELHPKKDRNCGEDYSMEIMVYEMKYVKDGIGKNSISCIPFEQKYFLQYMKIYNACFYEMRKSLDIKPYDFWAIMNKSEKRAKIFSFL